MCSHKILYTIGFLLLLSCKEKKQEVVQIKKTKSDTSVAYSIQENDTLQQSKDFISIKSDPSKAIREEKTYPSDLEGEWAVNCGNGLTTFSIGKEENIISLYGNSIYINVEVEKLTDGEYILKFKKIATQENWVEESLKITESDISKDKIIGKFFIKKDRKVELQWIGLYNIKKQKLEFVGNDFLLIKENGGKTPLILEPCH